MYLFYSLNLKKSLVFSCLVYFLAFSVFADNNKKNQKKRRLRDPFSKDTVYVSSANNILNDKLFVAGIIIMENEEKLAVLHVPGYDNNYFVSESETISYVDYSVSSNPSNPKIIHLKILKINNSDIVVAPSGDIQKQFIIR
jgi:hypothetical protein